MTWLSVIGSFLALAILVFKWWTDDSKKKDEKFNADKQAIKDAVDSGDNSRIHAIIDQLRR